MYRFCCVRPQCGTKVHFSPIHHILGSSESRKKNCTTRLIDSVCVHFVAVCSCMPFFMLTCTAQITVDPHFARCSGFARLIITTGALYRSAVRADGREGRLARELGSVAMSMPRMPCRSLSRERRTKEACD